MIEPMIYEINIAFSEKDKASVNFFYQKFDDYGNKKLREVIRIVNGFAPEPIFEYKPPISIGLATLNAFTEEAQHAAKLSGASINAELVHVLNKWLMERT